MNAISSFLFFSVWICCNSCNLGCCWKLSEWVRETLLMGFFSSPNLPFSPLFVIVNLLPLPSPWLSLTSPDPHSLSILLPPPLFTLTFSLLQWTCWISVLPRTPLSNTNSPTTATCSPSQMSSTAWRPSTTAWSRSTKTWSTCLSALTCASTGCSTFMTRTY